MRVLLAYEQNNAPMCRLEIDKANARDTAMYALLLLGIPPKLVFNTVSFPSNMCVSYFLCGWWHLHLDEKFGRYQA